MKHIRVPTDQEPRRGFVAKGEGGDGKVGIDVLFHLFRELRVEQREIEGLTAREQDLCRKATGVTRVLEVSDVTNFLQLIGGVGRFPEKLSQSTLLGIYIHWWQG